LNYDSLDDISLMGLIAGARSAGAHTDALGALYDRYGRLVFTVALHIVGDAETAEEITQDVFVRVWDGAHAYRSDIAKVSSWMVSITRYRAIDELRRRKVRVEKNQVDWLDDLAADGFPVQQGPEEDIESAMQRNAVQHVIASLPQEQRHLLGLAFFKGLSHSQIAEMMGQPLGTVKSRIRLAMQKVREAMKESGAV
jgi:RNA polymerase sigma-70 factor (ECF subfamily)